ncbi:RNA polymerase sigma factor [Herbihabitans rhizosphaerae]|uniref:RNA polymerase sigma factor n=1 Tax=Herbihabitans rhizosphaerae TaxID=1872711 RepID=UPI00102AFC7B|nr:sigma-70 family RNA polymerase sigma factor [Herbihabitans rhizosphaerae]
MSDRRIEDVLRELAPQVLGAVVRHYGQFDAAEDAVQEALLAAATQWPEEGVPDNPRGWLIRVASRRLTDQMRSESSRRRREDTVVAQTPADELLAPGADLDRHGDADDTLVLLFLCCHPALTPPSQIALTLRAVGGLATEEIAKAFLVPESTMGQRISRAKQRIKDSGVGFVMPPDSERAERLRTVLHVLYLIFNEGYASTSGPVTQRVELTAEAIRLGRAVRGLLPEDGEVTGLLALMLLTDARRDARAEPDGTLIPLDEQNRALWDGEAIAEGVALVTEALTRPGVGPYRLQAAISALHDEAPTAEETDWPQILALYGVLESLQDNPMVTLNKAVATAMVHGPRAGLDLVSTLDDDKRLAKHHRVDAVRAHLLEMLGDTSAAREAYRTAARRTASLQEQRYLEMKAANLADL